MSVNELLEDAKAELENIMVNEQFTLKDLFKGYIWNRIEQGTRSKLGTSFVIFVDSQDNIEVVKSTTGQKKYVKRF